MKFFRVVFLFLPFRHSSYVHRVLLRSTYATVRSEEGGASRPPFKYRSFDKRPRIPSLTSVIYLSAASDADGRIRAQNRADR